MSDLAVGILSAALAAVVGMIIVAVAAVATFAALLTTIRALTFTTAHLTARANPHQRAAVASVLAGARRARVWSFGSIGVAFVVGLDHDARRAAYAKLRPEAPPLRALARPHRRTDSPTDAPQA